MRLKDKLNVIVAAALLALSLIFVASAHAALPCNGVWISPFTYQQSQADAIAGNYGPITVSGTVNAVLQITCTNFHFNATIGTGCADSITSSDTCPPGDPNDYVTYPVGTNLFNSNYGPTNYNVAIDTTKMQNTLHDVGCSIVDAASGASLGNCLVPNGGKNQAGNADADMVLLVQNGVPPPTSTPSPTPTPTHTPSPNCTEVTTSGPTITDANNNIWALNSSLEATENGVIFDSSGSLQSLWYVTSGNAIWGYYPAGSAWYESIPAGTNWTSKGAQGPACSTATPTPTPLPPTPTPTVAPTPSPTPTPSAGPVCDGVTNDTAALNAQFAAGPSYLPFGKTCYAAGALTTPNDIDFNGGQIHSGITSGCALTITTGQNMYAGPNYTTPTLVGNGVAGTSGLCINGNHIDVDLANISGFGNDVQFGNFAYSIHFLNPYLYGASGTAFYFPGGLSDAGEGIVVEGGSIFNSTNGVVNYGGSMFFNGTSIDSISNLPIDNSGDLHFKGRLEMSAALPGAYIRQLGGNAYGHATIEDSEILNDPNQGSVAIENDGTNTYVKVMNTHFSGFPSNPTVTGSASSAVGFCNNTLGNGPVNNIPNQGPGC